MNIPDFSRYIEKITGNESEPPLMIKAFDFFHYSKVPLKVIYYDHHKRNVGSAFLNAIGCEKMGWEFSDATIREINESLTPSEVCLAQIAHEKISNPEFTAIFIRVAQSRKHRAVREYYNRRQHQSVLDRFRDIIRLVNSHLPEGQKLAPARRHCPSISIRKRICCTTPTLRRRGWTRAPLADSWLARKPALQTVLSGSI